MERFNLRKYFSEISGLKFMSIIFGCINNVTMIGSSIFIKKIIDLLIAQEYDGVKRYGLYFMGIITLSTIFSFLFQYTYRKLAYNQSFQLRVGFFNNFIYKKMTDILSTNKGDVTTAITSDTEKISDYYGTNTVVAIIMAVQFVITSALIVYYNAFIALAILAIVLLGVFLGSKASKKIGEYSAELQYKSGKEQSQILQTIDGIRTIKQLDKEKYFIKKYKGVIDDKKKTTSNLSIFYALYADIFSFISNTMPFATILLSLYFIINGNMTIGDAIGISSIAGALTEPVTSFGNVLNSKKVSSRMVEKNKVFLDENVNEKKISNFDFNELTFNSNLYSFGEREILKDVKFKLEKGGVYSIVGESGTGKSTIFNIISKFIPNNDVIVDINGNDIDNYNAKDIYSFAIQSDQGAVTINDTVLENIVLGDDFTKDEIEEVIKVAQLENFVKNKGLDFVIDDRGQNVSGGEKQRISLARILLRKPQLLMLDEPTSALDEVTSNNLVKDIVEYAKRNNMTLAVITHREDFTKASDEIIKIM